VFFKCNTISVSVFNLVVFAQQVFLKQLSGCAFNRFNVHWMIRFVQFYFCY
jgi:hypothetical protein